MSLFLMMLLAELARRKRVFDRLADREHPAWCKVTQLCALSFILTRSDTQQTLKHIRAPSSAKTIFDIKTTATTSS